MSNIYVSGPITGIAEGNRPEFIRVRKELMDAGHRHVCIPQDLTPGCDSWESCMCACIGWLCGLHEWPRRPFFDGLAMLDGWEQSRGARIEHGLATALGIPCKPWEEWL